MRYSHAMDTTDKAPEIYPGYPYKRRVYPAWQEIWDQLRLAGREYRDGTVVAKEIAERHGLTPATLTAVMSRAATVGLLDRELRVVPTTIHRVRDGKVIAKEGGRARTHYRIKV